MIKFCSTNKTTNIKNKMFYLFFEDVNFKCYKIFFTTEIILVKVLRSCIIDLHEIFIIFLKLVFPLVCFCLSILNLI